MPYDYSSAPPMRDFSELIPHGTVATVTMHIRSGGIGEDALFKRNKDGTCEMLDIEFSVIDGEFKGRKFWENWILNGVTESGGKDYAKAIDISRSRLKAALDCAYGLKPDDVSPEARAARTVSPRQLEGLTFIAKIGVEKGTPKNNGTGESWPDKNILAG